MIYDECVFYFSSLSLSLLSVLVSLLCFFFVTKFTMYINVVNRRFYRRCNVISQRVPISSIYTKSFKANWNYRKLTHSKNDKIIYTHAEWFHQNHVSILQKVRMAIFFCFFFCRWLYMRLYYKFDTF